MAVSMKSSVAVATSARTTVRPTVVVRATAETVDRRALLGLFAGAVGAALVAPQEASAMGKGRLPWQESTGGMGKGRGSMPKSSTAASMEGYTLEGFPGTKKPSYVEPKKRKALMAKARAQAEGKSQ